MRVRIPSRLLNFENVNSEGAVPGDLPNFFAQPKHCLHKLFIGRVYEFVVPIQ